MTTPDDSFAEPSETLTPRRRPSARGAGAMGRRTPSSPGGADPPAPRPLGPAERLLFEGPDRLSPPELLAIALGGTRPSPAGATGPRDSIEAARSLLAEFGSLRRAVAAVAGEWCALGADEPTAARVAASFALARRAAAESLSRGVALRSPNDIFERYHALLRDAPKERFLAVLLDGKGKVMREEWISEGTMSNSLVHPREVFGAAVREAACSLVLVHNHPSGDPEPSPEDRDVTHRLVAAGGILGIRIADHVVVGDGCYASFLERGWIEK